MVHGGSVGRLNYTVGTNYYRRNAIFNRDRAYSQVPPFPGSNARPVNANVSYEAIEVFLSQGQTPPASIYDADTGLLLERHFIHQYRCPKLRRRITPRRSRARVSDRIASHSRLRIGPCSFSIST